MGDVMASGERFAAARGVLALGVMLSAARLPDRLAEIGVTIAARIAPPEPAEVPEVPEVHVPAQSRRPAPTVASAPERDLRV